MNHSVLGIFIRYINLVAITIRFILTIQGSAVVVRSVNDVFVAIIDH